MTSASISRKKFRENHKGGCTDIRKFESYHPSQPVRLGVTADWGACAEAPHLFLQATPRGGATVALGRKNWTVAVIDQNQRKLSGPPQVW